MIRSTGCDRVEAEKSGFPLQLKGQVMAKAADLGGVTWSVYGINDQFFNNNVGAVSYKGERIVLTGYNYDDLYRYARLSVDLSSDRRESFDVWNLRNESITIGGLAFSVVALVFFLPAWIKPD